MPAFDPVRDAVLNSPIIQSPLASARIDLPSSRPTTATTPSITPSRHTTGSPVSRRATDLSVLLNEPLPSHTITASVLTESPLSTPTMASRPPRSLSDLLQPVDPPSDKLGHLEPFQRSSFSVSNTSSKHPFVANYPFTFTVSDLHPHQVQDPPSTPLSDNPSPPSHSPIFSVSSRPSTSSSAAGHAPALNKSPLAQQPKPRSVSSPIPVKPATMPPPPPPKAMTLPYKPRHRVSPPMSVLTPLSPQEIEFYKDPNKSRLGWAQLAKKRKRDVNDESCIPASKKSKDVGIVVNHYNTRPEIGVKMRRESPIIGLKNFNNWIKSVLFANFGHSVLASSPYSQPRPQDGRKGGPVGRGKVLDMGCGKGGDLNKWAKARIKEYVGLDIAGVSVDQARQRHGTLKGPRFEATFAACDCYTVSIASVLDPGRLSIPFDVVSLQFCMHYAFETEGKARCMMGNVSNWLRPGGVFVGTVPNAAQLIRRMRESPDHSFGNQIYNIRTDEPIPSDQDMPVFGLRYLFWLKDAVENVPEYIVHWDNFVRLASEYNLELKYRKEFHDVFAEFSEHSEFGPLMERMKVVNAEGDSQMDELQWEAANIYIAFVFEKH